MRFVDYGEMHDLLDAIKENQADGNPVEAFDQVEVIIEMLENVQYNCLIESRDPILLEDVTGLDVDDLRVILDD